MPFTSGGGSVSTILVTCGSSVNGAAPRSFSRAARSGGVTDRPTHQVSSRRPRAANQRRTASTRASTSSAAKRSWCAPLSGGYGLPPSMTTQSRHSSRVTDGGAGSSTSMSSASSSRLRDVLVGNRQRLVEDREPFLDLVARDRQRRADHDHVPVGHQVQAALERRSRDRQDRLRRVAARVERHERL